ncbi:YkgJ family cysteine cluster protein [Streptococcus mutans]|uniref:YkgJ family cysteine cluster protein n=1 Tax=Streptococcus mutans TaxID=1309 RepID=Q53UB6_STRMG|nr:YkgJ family cysteine cluster protein [Streptococcus mutans]MCB4934251.1 YkgJ family cysteine cluster protein [Streptococcus mutans]MCB4975881.1 YkgJ family cysteine cluster protein [Streptococcus mutans]MCB4989544.1 YkgJ family cysteine cluster protein [Streptococcus mutans]MCB5012157.1 YkgJ family cysteine cluster protein [Streptococcus mutans]MCB5021249.1 YkgJ family cysteine cluster protein [Streptococcus mutans]
MTQEIDIGKYYQLALQKQKEHRKFLATLKKKAPKNLDKIVQEVHTEVFKEIDCTKCANCCKILGPLFTEADISRIAKHFRMRLPVFEDMYLRVDEDNDKVFKSMPCPFLGEDNLCSIYDIRPKACREFPHTDRKKIYQINHLTIQNTLICPAVYLFVEKLQERLA